MKTGDSIIVKATGEKGIVKSVLPNPFTPAWLNWLIKPNYLVCVGDQKAPDVFTKKEIKLWKK